MLGLKTQPKQKSKDRSKTAGSISNDESTPPKRRNQTYLRALAFANSISKTNGITDTDLGGGRHDFAGGNSHIIGEVSMPGQAVRKVHTYSMDCSQCLIGEGS